MGEAGSVTSRPQTITLRERTTVMHDGSEGYYVVSDKGRVRSVDRTVPYRSSTNPRTVTFKEVAA